MILFISQQVKCHHLLQQPRHHGTPLLTRKNLLLQQSQTLQLPVKPVLAQPPVCPAVLRLLLPPPQQPQPRWRNSAPYCRRRRLKRCSRPLSGTQPSFKPHPRNGTCRRFKDSKVSSRRCRHRVRGRRAVRSTHRRSSRTTPPPPPPHRAPATRPDKQSRVHTQTSTSDSGKCALKCW